MTKTKFLTLLQERICMLDDAEQKDILDEYAQHIDMKVESGMTEAEAIEDFGPMDELAAEILGAYHVKPMVPGVSSSSSDAKRAGKDVVAAAADATKKGCLKLGQAASGAAAQCGSWLRGAKGGAGKVAGGLGNAAGKAAKGSGKLLAGLKDGSLSIGRFCLEACKLMLRWTWNFCVACLVAAGLVAMLCCIFGVGLCVILVVQGYPLGGVTVALLGAAMFSGSVSFLLMKLIRRKKTAATVCVEDAEGDRGNHCDGLRGSIETADGEGAEPVSATQPIPFSGLSSVRSLS